MSQVTTRFGSVQFRHDETSVQVSKRLSMNIDRYMRPRLYARYVSECVCSCSSSVV